MKENQPNVIYAIGEGPENVGPAEFIRSLCKTFQAKVKWFDDFADLYSGVLNDGIKVENKDAVVNFLFADDAPLTGPNTVGMAWIFKLAKDKEIFDINDMIAMTGRQVYQGEGPGSHPSENVRLYMVQSGREAVPLSDESKKIVRGLISYNTKKNTLEIHYCDTAHPFPGASGPK